MTAWLKVIGMVDGELRDDWGRHAPPLLRYASFSKRPGRGSFVPGDAFAYHAIGFDHSRVVAVGTVVDELFFESTRQQDPGWPWLAPIEIEAKRQLISEGFPLDQFDVERQLNRSVTQKSHIRLRLSEFQLIRRAFNLSER
jgi:hypothetical protein